MSKLRQNRRVKRLPPSGSSPALGSLLGALGIAAISLAVLPARDTVSRATPALLLVVPVVLAGVVGGAVASITVAVAGAVAFNLVFIPPFGEPKIDTLEDWAALLSYLVVAAVVGWLVVGQTDRRRAAEQREVEVRGLYEEVRDLREREAMLTEEATRVRVLEEVDAQRAALLRSVSHDLRTPLATIRAATSDLRDATAFDAATREELFDLVLDETERLDRLVANLLSLSRIEAGTLEPQRQVVDIDELVRDRVRRLARLFRQVRLQVEIPDDLPLVDGDYSQLDQVVTNLLENASRYAPRGSTVRVSAEALPAGRVTVRVADEGIGVPEQERERVFEPFRTGEGGSSGIGLATCRAIVEAHGGTVAVTRTPGGGATFVVTLPARAAER